MFDPFICLFILRMHTSKVLSDKFLILASKEDESKMAFVYSSQSLRVGNRSSLLQARFDILFCAYSNLDEK